ncbi:MULTISPECIES: hypothetical protein [unclassified Chryseobacterium]|uniref:hypothetical protein n=1 Tax=unclassified Chryseobacterium TaxID=2593645 RepID=UPI00300F850B
MMKNIVTIAKSFLLIYVLTLGTLYAYAMRPLFDQKKIESGKSNKKNKSTVIFVSEGAYVFNEDQMHSITKAPSSFPNKAKEIKTDKILFISEGTILYNGHNIFIDGEKKRNIPSAKSLAKKTYKEPTEVKKSKVAKPINIYFTTDSKRKYFILATDSRYFIPSTYNDYHKQLINENCFSLTSFVFPKDVLWERNNNTVSHSHIKVFSIRPPPF